MTTHAARHPHRKGAHPHASHDARAPWRRVVDLFVRAGESWVDDEAYRLGASLSYYAIFSLFPLLLLCTTAVGIAMGQGSAAHDKLLGFLLSGVHSAPVASMLESTLDDMQRQSAARGIGTVIGALGLLLGASGVFSELDTALNRVWRVKTPPPKGFRAVVLGIVHDKLASFALVAMACLSVIVVFAASVLASSFGERLAAFLGTPRLFALASPVAMFAVVLAETTALFMAVPQRKVPLRAALVGALVSALLLLVLRLAFRVYLSLFTGYAAYGVAGAMLALVTWIYLASIFVLYGAEVARVWHLEHRHS